MSLESGGQVVFYVSQSAIHLDNDIAYHSNTKRIVVKYHFVR